MFFYIDIKLVNEIDNINFSLIINFAYKDMEKLITIIFTYHFFLFFFRSLFINNFNFNIDKY